MKDRGQLEGKFRTKVNPLDISSSSFHSHFAVFSSFNTHSVSGMSVEWIDTLIPNSSFSLNEREMMQQHWIEWYSIILTSSKHLKGHSGPCVRQVFGPNICEVIRDPAWDRFLDRTSVRSFGTPRETPFWTEYLWGHSRPNNQTKILKKNSNKKN